MKLKIALSSDTKPGQGRFLTMAEVLNRALRHELHGIQYDQVKGLGAIPHNQEVGHKGFSVLMAPSTFLDLCYPLLIGSAEATNLTHIKEHIQNGGAIASPWLRIELGEDGRDKVVDGAYISGHEGRNRMKAISDIHGGVPVLVHITFSNLDNNKHLTEGMIEGLRKGIKGQHGRFVRGPLWQ
jgi:hypothetical protein